MLRTATATLQDTPDLQIKQNLRSCLKPRTLSAELILPFTLFSFFSKVAVPKKQNANGHVKYTSHWHLITLFDIYYSDRNLSKKQLKIVSYNHLFIQILIYHFSLIKT